MPPKAPELCVPSGAPAGREGSGGGGLASRGGLEAEGCGVMQWARFFASFLLIQVAIIMEN